MKNKILKIATIIMLIMTLTITNFIFVGSSLISYAANTLETNHKNVEFNAYFTDGNNQEISSVDMSNMEDIYLNMQIEVKNEGYFILPIRPPSVPIGTSRLRLSLTANIQFKDVRKLFELIKDEI